MPCYCSFTASEFSSHEYFIVLKSQFPGNATSYKNDYFNENNLKCEEENVTILSFIKLKRSEYYGI